jgi:heparan-alpha-glucosaminide N-acetyltransferase
MEETLRIPLRNTAVDAYRGLVMLLMMGEVLSFGDVSRALPGNGVWSFLATQQSHVEWTGMHLHDTIQPGFTFLAGVALPYSIASRLRKHESFRHMLLHTMWRSLVLIFLGFFLRSLYAPMTNFTFEDTLTQIGLGYTVAFLLAFARPRWQYVALGGILFAYWLAWALYPVAGPGFDWAAVGVPEDWKGHLFTGFAAHWNKNANLGQAFDVWFLNLLPRPSRFLYNEGGYLTLSFIPTLGTMLLGLVAGQWSRDSDERPIRRYVAAAVVLIAVGLVLHVTGICPIVKRIWTPSWTLFSGGVCFLFLAGFNWWMRSPLRSRLALPLTVVGMNSIAAYLMAHLTIDFIRSSLRIHLGMGVLNMFGSAVEPFTIGALTLLTEWGVLYWMYRRKIFLRV